MYLCYISRRGVKKIIGVPVIPGLPDVPLTIETSEEIDNDEEQSPKTARSRTPSTGSGMVAPASPHPWRLAHVDFLPRPLKEKSEDGPHETFRSGDIVVVKFINLD